MLREVTGTRYVTPLREGGSLPGLVEADDDGLYVVKFRGAGQGSAALVAEVVVGELGRRIGVRVPELVVLDLDPEIARREPDEEVQELLRASTGANLGMDFLPGSVGYDGMGWQPPVEDAARVFWLDAFTANIDRTWTNPNLLVWHRRRQRTSWSRSRCSSAAGSRVVPLCTGPGWTTVLRGAVSQPKRARGEAAAAGPAGAPPRQTVRTPSSAAVTATTSASGSRASRRRSSRWTAAPRKSLAWQ